MNILKVAFKRNVLLAFCLFSGISTIALAQKSSSAQLSVRFAHPQINAVAKTYSIDIEMKAAGSAQKLFGMNLRFFYDATELEFISLSELNPSYGPLNQLKTFKGSAASGSNLFNFDEATTYVNGAIQLVQEDAPQEITVNQWTKIGKLNFRIPESITNGSRLCPTLVWDLHADANKGGFLTGSDGVVVTVLENDPLTREISAPTTIAAIPFNWEYTFTEEPPYGHPLNSECFSVGVVSANHEITDKTGYGLFQNYPNPFAESTVIEFVLPTAQEARLVFCDVTGKIIHTIQGHYAAGQNAVKIERNNWTTQGSILFYRLETADHTSEVLKMTVMDH